MARTTCMACGEPLDVESRARGLCAGCVWDDDREMDHDGPVPAGPREWGWDVQ